MYLPACRISHTGVYGTGSRRQAFIKTESCSDGIEAEDYRREGKVQPTRTLTPALIKQIQKVKIPLFW
jgi:hypothetical protein